MFFLIVVNGPNKGRVFELPDELAKPQTIGRASGTMPVSDGMVSRDHAELRRTHEGWMIDDLGSTNGSFVNGRKVTEPTQLHDGDRIQIGCTFLIMGRSAGNRFPAVLDAQAHSDHNQPDNRLSVVGRDLVAGPGKTIAPPTYHAISDGLTDMATLAPPRGPRRRWIAVALVAIVMVVVGLELFLLIQSQRQAGQMKELVHIVRSSPTLSTDILVEQIRSAIAAQRHPESQKLLRDILNLVRSQNQDDPRTELMFTQVLAAVRKVPKTEAKTNQMLANILATVSGALEENHEELLKEILTAVKAMPVSGGRGPQQFATAMPQRRNDVGRALPLEGPVELRDHNAASHRPEAFTRHNHFPTSLGLKDALNLNPDIGHAIMSFQGIDNVVFLVDAFRSLADHMSLVIEELNRTIDTLASHQKFTVIFCMGNTAFEAPPIGMKSATVQMRHQVKRWAELSTHWVVPRGRFDAGNALRTAMNYDPQFIWILSDSLTGGGGGQFAHDQVMALLQEMNPDGRTRINTTQFFNHDAQNTLKRIAATYQGMYTFIVKPSS